MNILGIDIGYSNLKLAYGLKGESPKTHLRPAGAAPADRFGSRFDGKAHDDFLHVMVDGQEFIAGVSPDRAEMWSRSLHADYPSSASYKALFHAGLLLSEMDRIDMLVTGLPVSQYLDEARKQAVAEQMQGTHQVTAKRTVTVEKVRVIPQPVGGLLDYISQEDADIEDARVLVIDPGFFSVDWVVIANKDLHRQSSGTSLNASSVVLEEASRLIAKDYGSSVNTETLENAVRVGKPTVLVLG
ncbi:ParM/StbA family protein [Sulfuricystis multivorans]|uniref:ParM/StbA family protein n=1 Tax=Sulfuricystis multivorans TaxID=2211108 RepID=UPI0024DFE95A|nr:ParM/StbA family protein [Sulfuricystis multivorans]